MTVKPSLMYFGLVFALAVLGLTTVAFAAEGDSDMFSFQSMEFPGTRHDRMVSDVNGDGRPDIAMLFSRSDVRDVYWLRVCPQGQGAKFDGDCKVSKLPQEGRAFDLADIDGKPGAEFVLITSKGVQFAGFSGGELTPFKKMDGPGTIFSGTEQDRPLRLRFLWDLDGDGKRELILPHIDGPAIYSFNNGAAELIQRINSPARITYKVGSLGDIMATDDLNQFLKFLDYEKRTTINYTAPDVFVTDFNGDGRTDIVTLVHNHLKAFLRKADGTYPDKPDVSVKKSILPPEEKGMGFAGEAMTFTDLNGDGMADVIMMKWGSSEERTQMDRYIYYARKGLTYPEEPDQIVRSESAAVDFGFFDLNKDGKKDLVIPFFHFAPAQAFKVMTENAIKIQFRLFLMGDDGRYTQDPGKTFAKVDRRVLLNYKIDVIGIIFDFRTLLEGKFHPLISFANDFNGDGYLDLVADTGGDRLEFFWGNEDANYGRNPDHAIDFESAMDFDLVDLNGDGRTDIITYYESKEKTEKKREMAKKARQQGEPVSEISEELQLATAPEGTRVKILISK